ncbi:hypothetical protein V865_001899 [Kwoniella europaea PYCC6329]|uniref:BRCT domain-containing protein n=1 Tax=Kwoniella europaea PYCC6329 TaxID=1423913 RepID=A0AAX4KDM2_9TREE
MSGSSELFDGIGFYVHPMAKENILNSPIGKEIMDHHGIIYPIPSLDQVQIIIIPFITSAVNVIPLDPNFVWLDPDTLDQIRGWTPELLVRYFEDTIRNGEVIQGRKVVVGYGWVEKSLRAGRVMEMGDDWGGRRVRGSYDIWNDSTTSSHYHHSQIVPNPSDPSIRTIPLSYNISQPYSDYNFTNDSVISSVPHRPPPTSNDSNGNLHASKLVIFPQSLPSSHSHPVHYPSAYIHPGSEASSNRPNRFDGHTSYHPIQFSHLSNTTFENVPHPEPYLQQRCTSESHPSVHRPVLSRVLPSGAKVPITELIASETTRDYATHHPNVKEYPQSQPRYHPRERYQPYPIPSGVSPTHGDSRSHQTLLTLDKPLHPRKRVAKTPIIVPSQKITQAGYVPPTPISPVTWNRTSYPPLSRHLPIQSNNLTSAIQRQNRVKSSTSNAILQPTSMVGLSKPTWWDMSTSRTINIPSTPTKWQMAMNQRGNVKRREANISGTVTSVNTHTQAQRKISEKENEMVKRRKHSLDTHAVLATQPLRGEKSSGTTCQAQTRAIFIDSHGKPMKMYLAPNIHPSYQEKIKTEGGQICSRLHASIAIFYRTATESSPLMPKSIAENEAGWNCGKKGQVTVTLDWLNFVWRKGNCKKKKVVPVTTDGQVTIHSSNKPNPTPSRHAELDATPRLKTKSTLTLSSSFPSCPSLTAYDPISWHVEKIARRLDRNGKPGGSVTLPGSDTNTYDYPEKYESIIQDRAKELAKHYGGAGGALRNDETKSIPVSIPASVPIPSTSKSAPPSMPKNGTEVQTLTASANMQYHALDSEELHVTCSLVDRLLTRLKKEGNDVVNDSGDRGDNKIEELKALAQFFDFDDGTPEPVDAPAPRTESTSSELPSAKGVLTDEDTNGVGVSFTDINSEHDKINKHWSQVR